jgi:NADH-quinone oxidoreductase subunit I
MSAIKRILQPVADLWSLVVGLEITGKNFCRPQVTVHYPRQEIDPAVNASFRGPIRLRENPRIPGKSRCTACMICVSACPSSCITVVKAPAPVITPEQEQAFQEAEARGEEVDRPSAPREPVVWINDFSLCSLCGLCVEACPTNCIEFSHDLYIASTNREDFQRDLLIPFVPFEVPPAPADSQAKES